MGGEHVDRRGRGERRNQRGRERSRSHHVQGADVEPADKTGKRDAPGPDTRGSGAAPERLSFSAISTTALVLAAAGLMTLGLIARWVSKSEEAGSASQRPPAGAASRVVAGIGETPSTSPAEAPESRRTEGASGKPSPTRTVAAAGKATRELVVVPDSECHQFVETRQEFPTVTISVENLCQ